MIKPLGSNGSSHFRKIISSSGVKVKDSGAMPPGTAGNKRKESEYGLTNHRVSETAEMKVEMPQVEVRLQEGGRDHRPISYLSAALYATTDDSSYLPTHRVEENRADCKKQRERKRDIMVLDSFFKREKGI